jgi:hypothetical protein
MTAHRANEIATGIAAVVAGMGALVGFMWFIDYVSDGGVSEMLGGIWEGFPPLLRLVIVCLGAGVAVMFVFWWYMVRTAEDIDPHDKELNDLFDHWGHR